MYRIFESYNLLYKNPTPFSTCTQRVATILKEKGVPFNFKYITPEDVATEDYVENMQPFRQIPVLDDDGYVLCGTHGVSLARLCLIDEC